MSGAARGLEFLHVLGLVHQDIKPVRLQFKPRAALTNHQHNILVDQRRRRAVLSDQGLITQSLTQYQNGTTCPQDLGGTQRYMAPEIYLRDDPTNIQTSGGYLTAGTVTVPRATKSADVYSFGMTLYHVSLLLRQICLRNQRYQVMSNKAPFDWVPDRALALVYQERRRPPRPNGLTDPLWDLLQRCFDYETERRPKMAFLLLQVSRATESVITSLIYPASF
jgi:serine/threonine protein kinase